MSTPRRQWRLRTWLIVLLTTITSVSFLIVGATLILIQVPQISEETRHDLSTEASDMVSRAEALLNALQIQLEVVATMVATAPTMDMQIALENVVDRGAFSAIYEVALDGTVIKAATGYQQPLRPGNTLVGSDLSRNAFFLEVRNNARSMWSEKYASQSTGETAVSVGVLSAASVLIGEVPLSYLLDTLRVVSGRTDRDVSMLDGHGEVLADSNDAARVGILDIASPQFLLDAMQRPASGLIQFEGRTHEAALAHSPLLDWYFLVRTPSGLDNPRIATIVDLAIAAAIGCTLLGLLLAPLWAAAMSAPLRSIAERARRIADGEAPGHWPHSRTLELNVLADDLERMADALRAREEELSALNSELEHRVLERTDELHRSNAELSSTLSQLQMTQDDLIRSEKLASLGALVAGIAHELNTPLGNGVMAVSTIRSALGDFERESAQGLRRATLDDLVESVRTGTDIAARNLERAAELVVSFKQVATDQSSAQRRTFDLDEVGEEIVLTLRPLLRQGKVDVEVSLPAGLKLDSYPGALGQVLINLVTNAVTHAFEGIESPRVVIEAEAEAGETGRVVIRVRDNGCGIAPELLPRVFDPFVTTRMGRGGTGLGLHIAHNLTAQPLGGSIRVDSRPGEGTTFSLSIPRVAPAAKDTAG